MGSHVNQLVNLIRQFDHESLEDRDQKVLLVNAVEGLLARLQTPWDHVHRLTWMEPAYLAALKVAADVDLFAKWMDSGSGPKTVSELSAFSGIEEDLLIRLLRHMSAMGGLIEVARDTYVLSPFTESLAGPGNSCSLTLSFEATYPAFLNLPSFLAKNGYKNPMDSTESNWQDMRHSSQSYLDFLRSDAERAENFQNLMVAYNQAKGVWVDFYPTEDILRNLKPGRAILVDSGGGKGFDIEAFRTKHQDLRHGSLILQDLPAVAAITQPHQSIRVMAHDLFETQPIKGARAYFTHIVFHTWSNTDAIKVLHNFSAAMERGYSRLLLHEKVISDRNPTPDVTAMDLTMMATYSAAERTQTTWREMLAAAGLKINKIYASPVLFDAIIEAELC